MSYVLAIDQGTTSSRAMIFDEKMHLIATAQEPLKTIYPQPGYVEQRPIDIWSNVAAVCRQVIERSGVSVGKICGIGIANQRETTVLWDRSTGDAVCNAIVWQDRRTEPFCADLRGAGLEDEIRDITGLVIDPYFSASKIRWILDNIAGVREKAERGDVLFGTIDTYLIWKITGGEMHVTDAANASRTMLYDLGEGDWSSELLELFKIPECIMPKVKDNIDDFGSTRPDLFGRNIPICGVAGDQQSSAIGQSSTAPGMVKATYGTGCFVLMNTGRARVQSNNRLLTTVAYRIDGITTYALEGAIFNAGAVIQWLKDGIKIIRDADQVDRFARSSSEDLVFVPAFTGLGAPYWKADCRGAIFGLTRNSSPYDVTRAALESVGYQTRDLVEAMQLDAKDALLNIDLSVDGGMASSDWCMQFVADVGNRKAVRPKLVEATALGAAKLAGVGSGLLESLNCYDCDFDVDTFLPKMQEIERSRKYSKWRSAVSAVIRSTE